MLNLVQQPLNNAPGILPYPIINPQSIDVLYSKIEQKYRVNQFWDITSTRTTTGFLEMFNTEPNGYIKNINPFYVNYNKGSIERKRFRHWYNHIFLQKKVSNKTKILFKLALSKKLNSPR
jgi:hypothetical protein